MNAIKKIEGLENLLHLVDLNLSENEIVVIENIVELLYNIGPLSKIGVT